MNYYPQKHVPLIQCNKRNANMVVLYNFMIIILNAMKVITNYYLCQKCIPPMQCNKRNWKYGDALELHDNSIEFNECNYELLPVPKVCPPMQHNKKK